MTQLIGSAASTHVSVVSLAALALMIGLAVSASLSALLLSSWDVENVDGPRRSRATNRRRAFSASPNIHQRLSGRGCRSPGARVSVAR